MNFWERLFGFKRIPPSPKVPDEPPPPATPQRDESKQRVLFDRMAIRAEWRARVHVATDGILKHRMRYEQVERETGVPWLVVGVIHHMESTRNFKTHLHNGDPLTARTVHVPAGRPRTGTPPFTWEASAADALASAPKKLETIGEQFEFLERYNGTGYRSKGINTPYLWSGSSEYTRGRYVRDHVYDPMSVSDQVGAACIYKLLQERGILKI